MSERIVLDPRRVAHLSESPFTPIIKVWIGDYELSSLPPNYVVAFSINKSPTINGAGSNFTLTLFDSKWDEVEEALIKTAYVQENGTYTTQVKIMYGYAEGVRSKVYTAYSLLTYTVDIKSSGVMLVMSGIMKDSIDNMTSITLGTDTTNPTKAAIVICKRLGYLTPEDNFHPSKDMKISNADQYALLNDPPLQYISNVLAPQAIRESDGASGYKFWIDDSTTPPTANFRPMDSAPGAVRSYIYQKGVNTTVIDLQLNIEWIFGGSSSNHAVTRVTSQVIDESGRVVDLIQDINTARTIVTGDRTLTSADQSTQNVDAAGYSAQQMDAILKYRMSNANIAGYSGTMRILGDPDLKLLDYIRLIILTEAGILHHSSGVYRVDQISDSISGGEFFTSMQITKTENLSEGLVITNYRRLIK